MGTRANIETGGGGGSNIGNSDLTISAVGTRKLQMFGNALTDKFALRNSADTDDLFFFTGNGRFAIGEGATVGQSGVTVGSGSGTSAWTGCTAVGGNATNNGHYSIAVGFQSSVQFHGTVVGNNASTTSNGGVAIGHTARAGLNSTAIGYQADASAGQYNISIGENASCSAFFGIAIGRSSSANNRGVAINGSANTYGTAINGIAGGYALAVGRDANAGNHGTAVGFDTDASSIAVAVGRGMETSGIYSVSIGSCPYGQVRTNSVANTFNWFTDNANPVVRFGETADQWNVGTGSFGFGTMTPHTSAVVDVNSTTKGFLPPVMTTTEKNAIGTPASGLIVFDRTLAKLCVYTGASWETITSS